MDMSNCNFYTLPVGIKMVLLLWKIAGQFLYHTPNITVYDSTSGNLPERNENLCSDKDLCTGVCISLFVTAKNQKWPKDATTVKW